MGYNAEYWRKYKKENTEHIKEIQHKRYEKNKDKLIKYQKQYYQEHKEHIKEYRRNKHKNNKNKTTTEKQDMNDFENLNNASLYGRNSKTKRMHVSFRLTEQMEKELNEFADTYGISLSVLVRLAIQFYLKMNKQNKEN